MVHGFTIHGELQRALDEKELDAAIEDLFPFKTQAHVRGKLFGKPNYVYNIINDTSYDRANDKFIGGIKVYIELDKPDWTVIDDICAIIEHHEIKVTQVVRKWAIP